mmetsp:Transcript_44739/g.100453  ORF Transcript_44739/g.100453 Transcript_44739/m.100453 type:complete len:206 (+) Transcript_44739:523-1140(+)
MHMTAVQKACGWAAAAPISRLKILLAPVLSPESTSPMRSFEFGRSSILAANVTKAMPMSRAPLVLRISSAATSTVAVMVSHSMGCVRSPRPTRVVSLLTTRPMSWKPTKAWKMPMATVMADFRLVGRMDCIQSAAPHATRPAKSTACVKQHASAASTLSPSLPMMPKRTYVLTPMPAASPKGRLAVRPTKPEASAAEMQVARQAA